MDRCKDCNRELQPQGTPYKLGQCPGTDTFDCRGAQVATLRADVRAAGERLAMATRFRVGEYEIVSDEPSGPWAVQRDGEEECVSWDHVTADAAFAALAAARAKEAK